MLADPLLIPGGPGQIQQPFIPPLVPVVGRLRTRGFKPRMFFSVDRGALRLNQVKANIPATTRATNTVRFTSTQVGSECTSSVEDGTGDVGDVDGEPAEVGATTEKFATLIGTRDNTLSPSTVEISQHRLGQMQRLFTGGTTDISAAASEQVLRTLYRRWPGQPLSRRWKSTAWRTSGPRRDVRDFRDVAERAIRMVVETIGEHPFEFASIESVPRKLGIGSPESLRKWIVAPRSTPGSGSGSRPPSRSRSGP